jgi:hypothetical protein
MFGFVEWTADAAQRRSVRFRQRTVLGLRFCGVSVLRRDRTPEWLLRRRCASAAARLQKLGVTRAVFPESFPCAEVFLRSGIRPMETLPLYRAKAAELVRADMEARGLSSGSAVIAVCGKSMTAELQQAATELCIRNRYVMLYVPGEGERLCRRLRREYGAALVLAEDPEQLSRADVRVLFDRQEAVPRGGAAVLELYDGGKTPDLRFCLPAEREEQLPAGCDCTQLLAALCEAGALRPGQVEVSGSFSRA